MTKHEGNPMGEKKKIFAEYTKKNKFTAAKEYSDQEVAAYVERRKHDSRSKEEIEDDERWEKTKGKLIMALFAAGVLLLIAYSLKEFM
ncbi:hypothetical protein AALA24_02515 [Anaerovoracaceae bacterium 42-11]